MSITHILTSAGRLTPEKIAASYADWELLDAEVQIKLGKGKNEIILTGKYAVAWIALPGRNTNSDVAAATSQTARGSNNEQ